MSDKGSNGRNRLEEDGKTHFRNTSCDGDRFESTEESRFLHRGVAALLVKRTVQFRRSGNVPLLFYFADATGTPGTILTLFPWPGVPRGHIGSGQVTVTSSSVPEQSMRFWESRFMQAGVPAEKAGKRWREEVLVFADPEGLKLEWVASVWNRESHAWAEQN
jgi:catechol 2,3-dioxygenase-like lactoylglutathione lyase family enzyme